MVRVLLSSLASSEGGAIARWVALGLFLSLTALASIGFLTDALWRWLAAREGDIAASAIIGAALAGIFALSILVIWLSRRARRKHLQRTADPVAAMAEAFAMGRSAGQALRQH